MESRHPIPRGKSARYVSHKDTKEHITRSESILKGSKDTILDRNGRTGTSTGNGSEPQTRLTRCQL